MLQSAWFKKTFKYFADFSMHIGVLSNWLFVQAASFRTTFYLISKQGGSTHLCLYTFKELRIVFLSPEYIYFL